jgi:hypothetical protein
MQVDRSCPEVFGSTNRTGQFPSTRRKWSTRREEGEWGGQPLYTPPMLGACDRSHSSIIIYTLLGKQHGWLAAREKLLLCEGAVTTSEMRSEVDPATRGGLSAISAGVFKSPPRRLMLVYPGFRFTCMGFFAAVGELRNLSDGFRPTALRLVWMRFLSGSRLA